MILKECGVRGRPFESHSSVPCCLAQNVEAPSRAEPMEVLIPAAVQTQRREG